MASGAGLANEGPRWTPGWEPIRGRTNMYKGDGKGNKPYSLPTLYPSPGVSDQQLTWIRSRIQPIHVWLKRPYYLSRRWYIHPQMSIHLKDIFYLRQRLLAKVHPSPGVRSWCSGEGLDLVGHSHCPMPWGVGRPDHTMLLLSWAGHHLRGTRIASEQTAT